jgi:hypothetical protein
MPIALDFRDPLTDPRRLWFTQREAAVALGTTRYRVAQLLEAGELGGLSLGGPRLVTRRSLVDLQNKLRGHDLVPANDTGRIAVPAN